MHRLGVAEWTAAEYRDLLAAFARDAQNKGPALEELRVRLGVIFGERQLLFIGRGRHALELALRTFAEDRTSRTEVIVPAYICPSVIEAIEHANLTPVAADVRDDLNIDPGEVEAHITNRTLAVIVAHMYGCPAQIKEIEQICHRHGILLVDDAAQLAGTTIEGRRAGSFGTCGLVSFSLSKTIVAGSANAGAVLIVNDRSFEVGLRRKWDALPEGHYSLSDLARFLSDGLLYPEVSTISYRLQQIRQRWVAASEEPLARAWAPSRMANANAVVALRQIDSMATRIAGRVRVAGDYHRNVAEDGPIAMPQYAPGRYLTRITVRLPAGAAPPQVRRLLARHRIQTRLGYDVHPRFRRDMPHAVAASAQLIELPGHSRTTPDEVASIVATLKTAVTESNRARQALRSDTAEARQSRSLLAGRE